MSTDHTHPRLPLLYLLIFIYILFSSNAYALEKDKETPLTIQADNADIDNKGEVSTYQGNVKITQGSLLISADRLVINHPQGKIRSITAKGTPARYQYQAKPQASPVMAQAQTIVYVTRKDQVTLTGDAFLQQNKNQFNSEKIIYDIKKDHVQAYGAPAGKQIQITITPNTP
ncbi:MAG: lipopolysaccharide transport periplasmic protein LptA [Gammaproteobacteria bacterium]|nr:lipopolysaccharide transport periplasmic protein LptA [Gammaproteobacteria bacterium]